MQEERADAARNRKAILEAADDLFAASDSPSEVSMDDIARAAGVGKGTLLSLIHICQDGGGHERQWALVRLPIPPWIVGVPTRVIHELVLEAAVRLDTNPRHDDGYETASEEMKQITP